ncbi:MAG TPA: DUF6526 family protein [Pyrinomonadaceae bacterium]|nr:hypothetical protein [Acidobacteriota bacterium]HQZ96841.1 DUF6526 family protein [Pyrinomonadaceae bacterium]
MEEQQTYATHTRWFPLVHFVIMPLLLITLIYQIVRTYQEPSWDRGMSILFVLIVVLVTLSARLQALKAQDRLIRLEETLRYRELLSPELAQKASEMQVGKMISLRFASDEELPDLVGQVIEGKLSSPKEIKTTIKQWRGDHFRV